MKASQALGPLRLRRPGVTLDHHGGRFVQLVGRSGEDCAELRLGEVVGRVEEQQFDGLSAARIDILQSCALAHRGRGAEGCGILGQSPVGGLRAVHRLHAASPAAQRFTPQGPGSGNEVDDDGVGQCVVPLQPREQRLLHPVTGGSGSVGGHGGETTAFVCAGNDACHRELRSLD